MTKTITVFGATGMLGRPVTVELINAGFKITALVHDVEKAKTMFPSGVNFVKGDLQDLNAIRDSMKSSDGVYISLHSNYKEREDKFNAEIHGLDNILIAARESNVKQVAFLSSLLARNYKGGWWVFKAKKSGIERIRNSTIPFTILPIKFHGEFQQRNGSWKFSFYSKTLNR